MKKLSNISNYLKNVESKVIKNLQEAQQETVQKVLEDIKERAPSKTGAYADSIHIEPTKVEGTKISTFIGSSLTVTSKSNGNTYNLGYLLETGTNPHMIYPIDASALHFVIDGKDIFSKYVNHPGFTAFPHYSLALMKNQSLYKRNIRKAIRKAFKEAK